MSFFIQIFQKYAPVFRNYVLPFVGLFIIVYTIYLIKFVIWGND